MELAVAIIWDQRKSLTHIKLNISNLIRPICIIRTESRIHFSTLDPYLFVLSVHLQ